MPDRRLLALLLGSVLALGACSSTASPAASPVDDAPAASAETPEMSAPASMDAAVMPSESPAGDGSMTDPGMADPNDYFGSDPELQARLPASVEGVEFTLSSFDFSKVPAEMAMQAFEGGSTLDPWLKEHGKSWTDVSYAVGTGGDFVGGAGAKGGQAYAIRVRGLSSADLEDWIGISGMLGGEGTSATVGDRTTQYYGYEGVSNVWVWADGDAVFWVMSANKAFGEAIVSAIK